jgi:hypothetical protein
MAPHPELVLEYPDAYCLAKPGQEYITYLRWGGTMKLDLSSTAEADTYEYRWFDPKTGKFFNPKTVQGGGVRFFSAPGGYPGTVNFQDWVLHVQKK